MVIPRQHHVSSLPPSVSPSSSSNLLQQTRLYSSSNKNDNGGGVFGKLTRAAKKVLPFLKTDQEKQTALERKKVKQEVKGGIQEILKDAPLPIKMLGGMIAPIISSAASTMAETMGQQQEMMETLLQEAQACLVRDPGASQALGEPITVSAPFSQGSSTMIINGVTTTKIQAAFNVMGSKSSGVAQMDATQDGISSLVLQVNGRSINVNLSSLSGSGTTVVGGGGGGSSFPKSGQTTLGKNPKNAGEVIDVEFVEKDDDRSKTKWMRELRVE